VGDDSVERIRHERIELGDLGCTLILNPRAKVIDRARSSEIQVRALRAEVVHVEQDIAFELTLYSEVPGLHVRSIIPGRNGATDAKTKEARQSLRASGGQLWAGGKRIGDARSGRGAVVPISRNQRSIEAEAHETAVAGARGRALDGIVEYAVPGANHD